jgi:hypothetical protein
MHSGLSATAVTLFKIQSILQSVVLYGVQSCAPSSMLRASTSAIAASPRGAVHTIRLHDLRAHWRLSDTSMILKVRTGHMHSSLQSDSWAPYCSTIESHDADHT